MPDSIERTIFKLELDGSAYVDGADKVTASTNKLTQAQEAANKKLSELQTQEKNLKKELEEVDIVIKANEKETLALTKDLNLLKEAGKGASAEAKNLQSQLRGVSTSTKEFKIESAALKTNLNTTTVAIKDQVKQVAALEPATGGATKGFSKLYSGLQKVANIIPGLGIGGLLLLVAGPLVDAITSWIGSMDLAADKLDFVSDAIKGTDEESNNLKSTLRELGDTAEDIATNAFANLEKATKGLRDELGETPTAVEVAQGAMVILEKQVDDLTKKYKALSGLAVSAVTGTGTGALGSIDVETELSITKSSIDKTNDLISEGQKKLRDNFIENQKLLQLGQRDVSRKTLEDNLNLSIDANNRIVANDKNSLEVRKKALKDNLDSKLELNRIELDRELQAAKGNEIKIALAQEKFRFENLKATADFNEKVRLLTEKGVKEAANVYLQELQKLKAEIAKLDSAGFTTEASITKAIEEDFKIRNAAFDKAFKNKQLTAQQLTSLQGYLKNLQDLTLNAQLKSFREQKQDYLTAISDEITALQLEEGAKRIQAIQDSFERDRQTIIAETDKTIAALSQRRDKSIADIIKNAPKSGLSQDEISGQINQIKETYSKLLDDLQIIKNQKLQQLSFETFEALTEDAKRALDAENLGISQGSLFRIREQAALFQQGKISFAEYQKALTEIAKGEAQERFNVEVAFLRAEIKIRQDKLAFDKDLTDAQVKRLKDEIRKLEQQLADAEKGNIIAENTPDKKKKTDSLVAYAGAINSLVDSVIGFWQAANEAEQKALDRSISLQEKRVEAAQKLADRGNAQYLRSEVDKLNELNVARENAARKQLGIDAALQASQILVGITGAISKIAAPGIGAAETIAEIAIIIGALATGYGLVKSLQSNQPKLYKGTKYLKREGHTEGVDTIPAMLTEGEAVIPKDKNKEYKETVAAVYDRSIPAHDLNEFVKTYHNIKPVAQANYERIREVTELKISQDGKMSVVLAEQNELLKENTELQKQTLKAIKSIGVNVSMDKNGLAVSVLEAVKQIEINKRV